MKLHSKHLYFVVFEAIFMVCVFVLSATRDIPVMSLQVLPFFALAVFRMARTISFNEVAEPIRFPFTVIKPDSCGAGANVHPRGVGIRYAIGSLISCPICSGTWSALALYGLWIVFPSFGQTLVYVLAAAGGSEMLHWLACNWEWNGREARVNSGKKSPDENSGG